MADGGCDLRQDRQCNGERLLDDDDCNSEELSQHTNEPLVEVGLEPAAPWPDPAIRPPPVEPQRDPDWNRLPANPLQNYLNAKAPRPIAKFAVMSISILSAFYMLHIYSQMYDVHVNILYGFSGQKHEPTLFQTLDSVFALTGLLLGAFATIFPYLVYFLLKFVDAPGLARYATAVQALLVWIWLHNCVLRYAEFHQALGNVKVSHPRSYHKHHVIPEYADMEIETEYFKTIRENGSSIMWRSFLDTAICTLITGNAVVAIILLDNARRLQERRIRNRRALEQANQVL